MSRRIAHRPRYQMMRSISQTPLRSHKEFLRNRWTYRRQVTPFRRRPLGQGLLLIPWGYRAVRSVLVH